MFTPLQKNIYEIIVSSLGLNLQPQKKLSVLQTPGYLQSCIQVHDFASAIMGAFGLAVEELGQLRGLPAQQVTIDRRHSGMILNSVFYHYQNGWAVSMAETLTPVNNFYKTKDNRWVCYNGAYPHLRDGILEHLNCANNNIAIAAATAGRLSHHLENNIGDLNLCGVIMRSPEEWLAHPQGKYLASIPPIEIKNTGNNKCEIATAYCRPLEGIKVVELTRAIAGPTIGRQLAEQGADVIHIRHPYKPFLYPLEIETSYGKKNVYLDYYIDEEREHFEKLISEADILICGYRTNALDKAGFDEKRLRELNKNLIIVRLNAYGFDGPWANHRGWEQNAQTCSGLAYLHSTGSDEPHLIPALISDYSTGYLGALGAVAALIRRQQEGGGWEIHVSLTRTVMLATQFADNQEEAKPLTMEDLQQYAIDQETPEGIFTRIAPPVIFSTTPSMAIRPNSIIGSSPENIGWNQPITKETPAKCPHIPSRLAKENKLNGVELGHGIEVRG